MQKVTIVLIFSLLAIVVKPISAQSQVDEKEMVGFACYFAGKQTNTLEEVGRILEKNNYKALLNMLTSKNNAKKYMAVICLEKFSSLEKFELTNEHLTLISEIKSSTNSVSVCSGCTYFNQVTLKSLFEGDMKLVAQSWLQQQFNGISTEP
ncbi:hypothetical protein [Fulvivirga sediminis]|uniref:Uncharacterized protein n=1 Tax=Fulvivirga sediminis TaxID=2803949 RepID=A0A937F5R0_9BACT|nr:hypothetical protein [Fulvivirga sediminis]MBL3654513.1 hypothetical protein [Fulvivirga sediminis]